MIFRAEITTNFLSVIPFFAKDRVEQGPFIWINRWASWLWFCLMIKYIEKGE